LTRLESGKTTPPWLLVSVDLIAHGIAVEEDLGNDVTILETGLVDSVVADLMDDLGDDQAIDIATLEHQVDNQDAFEQCHLHQQYVGWVVLGDLCDAAGMAAAGNAKLFWLGLGLVSST